jgi:hypothetical protein
MDIFFSNVDCANKHLILGDSFNQPIDNLPNSITHLTLGNSI